MREKISEIGENSLTIIKFSFTMNIQLKFMQNLQITCKYKYIKSNRYIYNNKLLISKI